MSLNNQMAGQGSPDFQSIPPAVPAHTVPIKTQADVEEDRYQGAVFTPAERQAIAEEFDKRFPPVQAKDVRQSRDRAQYVRQQRGHSLTLHLLLGAFVLWIPAIYYSVSPNHYWHV